MRTMAALLAAMGLAGGCNGELDALLGTEVYFVKLDAEPARVAAIATDLSDAFGLQIIHTYDSASEGFSTRLPAFVLDDLRGLDEVEYVRLDDKVSRLPPDEGEADPVADPAPLLTDAEIPESISRIGGPFLGSGLDAIEVAVIDSGIDGSHPDLNVVGEIDVVAQGGGQAAPGQDPNGHGTHVAGTIGAVADGDGVVGAAPGVALHAVRVLDGTGLGYTSDIIAGIEYVLEHPEIRVVNLSLGGPAAPVGEPDPMRDALERLEEAGVVAVIAAGNEGGSADDHSPANYDIGIVVSAYDASGGSDNGFAWFTNSGGTVDVAAPGVGILSTWPGGQYATLDGTSMATPAVAGAVAAFLATEPGAGVVRVRNQVISHGELGYTGHGGDHPEPLLDLASLAD